MECDLLLIALILDVFAASLMMSICDLYNFQLQLEGTLETFKICVSYLHFFGPIRSLKSELSRGVDVSVLFKQKNVDLLEHLKCGLDDCVEFFDFRYVNLLFGAINSLQNGFR